jgi:hypothetical protein
MASSIAEPLIVEDTWHDVPVALKFFHLQEMAVDASFELYTKSGQFWDHLANWAHQIDEEMINELFSLLFLLHDDKPRSPIFMDWLWKHSNQHNCPYWSILSFSWKIFFNELIGHCYVMAVMTAN